MRDGKKGVNVKYVVTPTRDELVWERDEICDVCRVLGGSAEKRGHFNMGVDRHHGLFGRAKGVSVLNMKFNLFLVCKNCHEKRVETVSNSSCGNYSVRGTGNRLCGVGGRVYLLLISRGSGNWVMVDFRVIHWEREEPLKPMYKGVYWGVCGNWTKYPQKVTPLFQGITCKSCKRTVKYKKEFDRISMFRGEFAGPPINIVGSIQLYPVEET